jgi:hypothetical protein
MGNDNPFSIQIKWLNRAISSCRAITLLRHTIKKRLNEALVLKPVGELKMSGRLQIPPIHFPRPFAFKKFKNY